MEIKVIFLFFFFFSFVFFYLLVIMDAVFSVVDPAPIQQFAKDSYRLIQSCTKPDRKGRF